MLNLQIAKCLIMLGGRVMDFSFVEQLKDDIPPAEIAEKEEIQDLIAVAKYVPLLKWVYDPAKGGPEDNNKMHLGFITQALKKVPGLDSAVSVDENGVERFDSNMVAAASLSLVAALARKVLGINLEEDYGAE